jgi:hypothetical protein
MAIENPMHVRYAGMPVPPGPPAYRRFEQVILTSLIGTVDFVGLNQIGAGDFLPPLKHNEIILVYGVGFYRYEAYAYPPNPNEAPGYRVIPSAHTNEEPGYWEWIGDPGILDATWFTA